MKRVTINREQRLYVIPCAAGFSCLGFDVCRKRCKRLVEWLTLHGEKDLPPKRRLGSLAEYERYRELMRLAEAVCQRQRIRCDVELTKQLLGKEGKRVEVIDRYGEKRRFYVGKSTGWMPCHLEIARRDSYGGPAVMGTPFESVSVVY